MRLVMQKHLLMSLNKDRQLEKLEKKIKKKIKKLEDKMKEKA